MSTRRTRRTAATTEVTEEVTTVETRSKRTRAAAAPRKAAPSKTTKATKDTASSSRSSAQPTTRSDAVASTPAPSTTPAPATNKRRLRSTTEAASPLRALDEQPAKKQRITTRKVSTPVPASTKPVPAEDDEEETPIFFTKSFDHIRTDFRISSLEDRNARLEAICDTLRQERDEALAELARAKAKLADLEHQLLQRTEPEPKSSPVQANSPTPEFDSFDVEEPEPAKPSFMSGDESAMALLRHVQEAARAPAPTSPGSPTPPASPAVAEAEGQHLSQTPVPTISERPSTPSRSLFGSFTSPFTAIKNLFGSTTPAPPSPTPSRLPPANTLTEALSIPPTPVGERPKRPAKKPKKQSRMLKALLRGIDQQDKEKATAWAKQIAAELHKDSTSGDKRKRLETPVLFRDLKHFPSSKPWQSGFSFPEDVLDLEDDDIVPAWAVYTSMIEEEQHDHKKTKTAHTTSTDDDMPASLNEVFGASTVSEQDFHPRRSIDPSPMFDTPLHHKEGANIFTELDGHEATISDRESLLHQLKAASTQKESEKSTPNTTGGLHRAHDPTHGSFSVPESDSEEEEEEEARAQPVWTQAPPPAPTPAHITLPNTSQVEEVERQRQKAMKHTPHKPSRLQQVSYPSPSVLSDAGLSPAKGEWLGDLPVAEPLLFEDPELEAAYAAAIAAGALQAHLDKMNWSAPVLTYDSDEEDVSPV